MKYQIDIFINKPLAFTIDKLDNLKHLKHWQEGLTHYTMIKGKTGEEGAKTKLEYDFGKRKMTLIETIIKNDLPHQLHASYDTQGVHNIQKNYFSQTDDGKTHWVCESEFKFEGWGMKVMGFLMPNAFKKQSLKYMRAFKAFAEEGTSVSQS